MGTQERREAHNSLIMGATQTPVVLGFILTPSIKAGRKGPALDTGKAVRHAAELLGCRAGPPSVLHPASGAFFLHNKKPFQSGLSSTLRASHCTI